jgi:hypothetical protein
LGYAVDSIRLVFSKDRVRVAVVGKSGTILLETMGVKVPSAFDPSKALSWEDLRRQLAK